jgi:hypothetical protein
VLTTLDGGLRRLEIAERGHNRPTVPPVDGSGQGRWPARGARAVMGATSPTECPVDVLHQQYQVQLIRWRRFELRDEVAVEVAGVRRLSVDDQTSTSDLGPQLGGASNHVGEEPGTQAAAFVFERNAQDGPAARPAAGIDRRPGASARVRHRSPHWPSTRRSRPLPQSGPTPSRRGPARYLKRAPAGRGDGASRSARPTDTRSGRLRRRARASRGDR